MSLLNPDEIKLTRDDYNSIEMKINREITQKKDFNDKKKIENTYATTLNNNGISRITPNQLLSRDKQQFLINARKTKDEALKTLDKDIETYKKERNIQLENEMLYAKIVKNEKDAENIKYNDEYENHYLLFRIKKGQMDSLLNSQNTDTILTNPDFKILNINGQNIDEVTPNLDDILFTEINKAIPKILTKDAANNDIFNPDYTKTANEFIKTPEKKIIYDNYIKHNQFIKNNFKNIHTIKGGFRSKKRNIHKTKRNRITNI